MDTIDTKSQPSPLVVVCGADDNYAMPLAVTLYSALVNLEKGCTLYLYIIDGGISERSRKRLSRVLEVEHVDLHLKWVIPSDATLLSGIKRLEWVTAATYLRLLIPDVVPEQFEKAIYLDSDLLVKANLRHLWDQEIGSYALLAVREFGAPYVSFSGGVVKYKELGLAPDAPCFNAGVLVMNLKRWREEKISQKAIQYLRKYEKEVEMADQEGLNAVLANNWGMLDHNWNVISHILFYEQWQESAFKEEIRPIREELIRKAYIFHFVGGSKPWQIGCEHPAQLQWKADGSSIMKVFYGLPNGLCCIPYGKLRLRLGRLCLRWDSEKCGQS
jgi:lipopolysaccharide biosynthesis glycosyltransferase